MCWARKACPFEPAALWQLARAADGSMRDSLSLTDQAIAFGNGSVSEAEVSVMLGTIDQGQVMKMVRSLAAGNAVEVLGAVAELSEHAPDYASVLNDMLSVLHRIAVAQAVPDAVDNSQGDREQVIELAAGMMAEDVQLYYQVGLVGKRDLPLAPDPRGGFEMALLRMLAFRPDAVSVGADKALNTQRENSGGQAATDEAAPPVESEPEPAAPPEPVEQQVVAPQPGLAVPVTEYQNPLPENFAPVLAPEVEPQMPAEVPAVPNVEAVPQFAAESMPASQADEVPVEVYDEAPVHVETAPVEQTPPISKFQQYAQQAVVQPEASLPADEAKAQNDDLPIAPDSIAGTAEKISLADLDPVSWVPIFRSLPAGRRHPDHCFTLRICGAHSWSD